MNLEVGSPHEKEADEKRKWDEMYEGLEFIDDVHEGRFLNKNGVMAARKLEMDFFKRMGSV